jgi:hypothetical protein
MFHWLDDSSFVATQAPFSPHPGQSIFENSMPLASRFASQAPVAFGDASVDTPVAR